MSTLADVTVAEYLRLSFSESRGIHMLMSLHIKDDYKVLVLTYEVI